MNVNSELDRRMIAWGGCGRCGAGVGIGGWLVWNREGTLGTFACGNHVRAIRAANPGGEVEEI